MAKKQIKAKAKKQSKTSPRKVVTKVVRRKAVRPAPREDSLVAKLSQAAEKAHGIAYALGVVIGKRMHLPYGVSSRESGFVLEHRAREARLEVK